MDDDQPINPSAPTNDAPPSTNNAPPEPAPNQPAPLDANPTSYPTEATPSTDNPPDPTPTPSVSPPIPNEPPPTEKPPTYPTQIKKPNILLYLIIILLITTTGFFAYKYFSKPTTPTPSPSPTPTATPIPSPTPTPTPSPIELSSQITGKLCYPSEFLPPGEIVAKNLSSKELTSQEYPGTDSGGASTYTLSLSPGSYAIRYQAQADLSKPEEFTSGYYTQCAIDPENCLTDDSHAIIPVVATESATISDIDLCDFYYTSENEPTF